MLTAAPTNHLLRQSYFVEITKLSQGLDDFDNTHTSGTLAKLKYWGVSEIYNNTY